MKNKRVIVITGPTAVGKSDVAVLVAQKIDAEIISADSSQIYKGFDIGSGKITKEEMCGVPHHLIDVLNFDQEFNVALFKNMAEEKISQIFETGKNVVICGGTGLYIKALVQGFQFYNVPKNEKLRQELEELYNQEGNVGLYKLLKTVDNNISENIDKNNKIRLIRAIEIAKSPNSKSAFEKPRYKYDIFVLNTDRNTLYNRINARVEDMFEKGLENEVSALIKQGANLSHSSFKSIGYKELYGFIADKQGTLEEIKEQIKQASRKYAKRQLTWFRAVNNAVWINAENKEKTADEIIKLIKN